MDSLMAPGRAPYRALAPGGEPRPLIVVDVGYSSSRRSCGIACSGKEPRSYTFGRAVGETAGLLLAELTGAVLVLEAPLSTCHDHEGNPTIRGGFEKGRGWWYGAGAVTLLAAQRFLQEVARHLPQGTEVALTEAFLSNKSGPTEDAADAMDILSGFWRQSPEALDAGAEPISPLVQGIPPVRVFVSGQILRGRR